MKFFVQKINQLNLVCTNSNARVLLYLFWQFTGLYGSIFYRKNHKALLWDKIRPNLLRFISLIFYAFPHYHYFKDFNRNSRLKKKKEENKNKNKKTKKKRRIKNLLSFAVHLILIVPKEFFKVYLDSNDEISKFVWNLNDKELCIGAFCCLYRYRYTCGKCNHQVYKLYQNDLNPSVWSVSERTVISNSNTGGNR